MSVNRSIQCIVLLSSFGGVRAELRAEPILLVEIQQHGFVPRSFVGQPVDISFVTEVTDHTTQTVLGGTYDSSNVGTVLSASTQQLAGIETAFHASGGRFWFDDSSHAPAPNGVDAIWEPAPIDWVINLHVPRLGHGLTGYDLTSITQTIHGLSYIQSGGDIYADQTQIIRFYGEVIPEPTCLILIAQIAWVFNRRWRY
jgi:hypothetical protein